MDPQRLAGNKPPELERAQFSGTAVGKTRPPKIRHGTCSRSVFDQISIRKRELRAGLEL
jgi:hypothetical protein